MEAHTSTAVNRRIVGSRPTREAILFSQALEDVATTARGNAAFSITLFHSKYGAGPDQGVPNVTSSPGKQATIASIAPAWRKLWPELRVCRNLHRAANDCLHLPFGQGRSNRKRKIDDISDRVGAEQARCFLDFLQVFHRHA